MPTESPEQQVLIAGAGPVGMFAAFILARSGVSVTVLEAGSELSTQSRASTFHPPTLEMLEEYGMLGALREEGLDVPTFQYRDRKEGLVAELDLSLLARDTPYPFRVQCEQSKLTRIVLDHLTGNDRARVLFDAQVTEVDQHENGVTVRLADGRDFTASYLIGADGASSVVRKQVGGKFGGITYPERYIVISTQEDIKAWIPDIAYVNYISDPDEWLVLLRTPQHWRAMFPVREGVSDEEALDPENVQRLLGTIGDKDGAWPILHTTLYRVHQRVANAYRFGRVFLAGDAAHINNPLGGLGMNSGLHDVYHLAPLIADVLKGAADDQVLDSYDRERRRVSQEYVAIETDKNWRKLRETDEVERRAWQDELRAIVADPIRHLDYVRGSCMLSANANARS